VINAAAKFGVPAERAEQFLSSATYTEICIISVIYRPVGRSNLKDANKVGNNSVYIGLQKIEYACRFWKCDSDCQQK